VPGGGPVRGCPVGAGGGQGRPSEAPVVRLVVAHGWNIDRRTAALVVAGEYAPLWCLRVLVPSGAGAFGCWCLRVLGVGRSAGWVVVVRRAHCWVLRQPARVPAPFLGGGCWVGGFLVSGSPVGCEPPASSVLEVLGWELCSRLGVGGLVGVGRRAGGWWVRP
jgi:hypothetical protein